jgi:hypothetical protein
MIGYQGETQHQLSWGFAHNRLKSNGWPLPTSMYKVWQKNVTKSKSLQVRNKERNYIYAFCWGRLTLCKITGLCMGFKVQQRILNCKIANPLQSLNSTKLSACVNIQCKKCQTYKSLCGVQVLMALL